MIDSYVIGIDLGQARDYTAMTIVQAIAEPAPTSYHVRHIERLPLGTAYPAVVDHANELVTALTTATPPADVLLALDATGVGRAVADMFTGQRLGCPILAVTITAGDSVHREGHYVRVPKRDLAGLVQVLLQSGRLLVAEALPLAGTLRDELLGFRVKITTTGHDTYGAGEDWRSAPHDDLVLALAIGLWAGEHGVKRIAIL